MKVLLLTVLFLLASMPVFAFECPEGYSFSDVDQPKLHHHSRHKHCYKDTDTNSQSVYNPSWAVGPGVDVPLWKHDKFDIVNENKYDVINEAGSSYFVVQIKSEKGIFQHIGDYFRRLFNK